MKQEAMTLQGLFLFIGNRRRGGGGGTENDKDDGRHRNHKLETNPFEFQAIKTQPIVNWNCRSMLYTCIRIGTCIVGIENEDNLRWHN